MAVAVKEKRIDRIEKTIVPLTWPIFKSRYLSREDAFKYEWVDGKVEKTPRKMDKTQFFIYRNLFNFLKRLQAIRPINGLFIQEGDAFFSGNHRRPDIAFYTDDQIDAARENKDVHAYFVIEVISKTDQINRVEKKMEDYDRAGVKVIWLVFPDYKKIHVYHGNKMTICRGDEICSAEPVIEGFLMPASAIFQ